MTVKYKQGVMHLYMSYNVLKQQRNNNKKIHQVEMLKNKNVCQNHKT